MAHQLDVQLRIVLKSRSEIIQVSRSEQIAPYQFIPQHHQVFAFMPS